MNESCGAACSLYITKILGVRNYCVPVGVRHYSELVRVRKALDAEFDDIVKFNGNCMNPKNNELFKNNHIYEVNLN